MIHFYLDVDGVFNAVTGFFDRLPAITGLKDYRRATASSERIIYSQEVVDKVNQWAAREDVVIKWVTSWDEDAATDLSPAIGLNGQNWPVLTGDQTDWNGRHWWKLQAVRRDLEEFNPEFSFWIDDDISLEAEACAWVDGRSDVKRISPTPWKGITASIIETVETQLRIIDARKDPWHL